MLPDHFSVPRNSRSPWIFPVLIGLGIVLALLASCRLPSKELPRQKGQGTIFDTAYQPQGENAPALLRPLEETYHRYHKTLSEPVAVTKWSEESSRWKIFFATNRGQKSSSGSSDVSATNILSNEVMSQPTWGEVEAVVPGRSRGKTVFASGNKLGMLPAIPGLKKQESQSGLAFVNQPELLGEQAFLAGLREQVSESTGKDLLVFVHGFNVDFDSAILSTAQLGLDMPFNGALCCYSWPSQGGLKNYRADEQVNAESVEPFMLFLQTLIGGLPPETRIHLVVHSMGNRLVLRSLDQLSRRPTSIRQFDQLAMCAPDVGVSEFRQLAPGVCRMVRRVTLYVGDSDTALIASKGINHEQRIGDAVPVVVVPGVETVDCSAVEMSLMGHSYFAGSVPVLCDLFSNLKEDLTAEKRPWLTAQENGGETHWKFSTIPTPVHVAWNFSDEKLATSLEDVVRN